MSTVFILKNISELRVLAFVLSGKKKSIILNPTSCGLPEEGYKCPAISAIELISNTEPSGHVSSEYIISTRQFARFCTYFSSFLVNYFIFSYSFLVKYVLV